MANLVSELAAQAAHSPAERVRLLDLILESLQDTSACAEDEAWSREIERRVAAHGRGEGKLYELNLGNFA